MNKEQVRQIIKAHLEEGETECRWCFAVDMQRIEGKVIATYNYPDSTLVHLSCPRCGGEFTLYISSQKFENLVIDKIKEHILTYDNLKELVSLVNEEMDAGASEYQKRLKVVSVEIAGVNQRLERLYDALETGSLQLADLAPRIKRLRERQEQLHMTKLELENLLSDRKVELADTETVKNYVVDLHNLLKESTLVERKSFIKSFVKEVEVTGDEVLLTSTVPFSPRRVPEQKVEVLSTVHYGGR